MVFLIAAIFCWAVFYAPTTAMTVQDDRENWKLIAKTLDQTSRSGDPNATIFEQILQINARARGSGIGRSDGVFLFEGDIAMNKIDVENMINGNGTSRRKRAVITNTGSNLWKKNQIAYTFSNLQARARSVVRSGIAEWQDAIPCMGVPWRYVNGGSRIDHMIFFQGGGCFSQVGRVGRGGQRVSIGRGCEYHGIAVHEIGHAMGLWHEQSRPDRDNYVRILWNHIIPAMKYNFQKQTRSQVNSLGVPYDYGSVMHYGATAFARGRGLRTIASTTGNQKLGQRRGLSSRDKEQVRLLYGCTKTTTITKPTKPTGCTDTPSLRSWCIVSQKLGFCSSALFKNYMKTHCCSTCKPKPTPKPKPKPKPSCLADRHRNCRAWKQAGYCKAGSQHAAYMKINCCKTCSNAACRDIDSRCPGWLSYCRQSSHVTYMRKNCQKTCRVCT